MKLLFVSNLYPPGVVGGYEVLCHQIAGALAGRGHTISVLTSDYGVPDPANVPAFPGQTVERALSLPASRGNIYQPLECTAEERDRIRRCNSAVFERKLRTERPDVVFVWNLYFLDPSLLETIQRAAPAIVYLLTDVWLLSFLNGSFVQRFYQATLYGGAAGGWRQRWCDRWRRWRPLGVRGRAIFPSRFMQALHRRAGIRFDGTTVIHHGADLPELNGAPPTDRAALRRPGRLALLFAGRIVHVKGVHCLIEALPVIVRRLPELDVRLTVLGDDRDAAYLSALHEQIRRLGLQERVRFAPAVAERELPGVFAGHDIYLFPSLHEPFSLTLIHALAAGIPTAASDAGGNPEIVTHRVTGMLYPKASPERLAAAVVELAGDAGLRQRLSQAARDQARTFTTERMTREVECYLAGAT
jgi:glycosyltransferase involved in cell wall biosynthesis